MKTNNFQAKDDNPRVVRFQLQFDPQDVSLQQTPFGVRITMPDGFPADEPGGPAFPAKIVQVVLPAFSTAERVAVTIGETSLLMKGPVMVAPLQKPQPGAQARKPRDAADPTDAVHYIADEKRHALQEKCGQDRYNEVSLKRLGKPKFEAVEAFPLPPLELPKPELYERALKAGDLVVRIIKTEQFGPNSVALLEVKPIRYTKEGSLEICTSIEISLYCRQVDFQDPGFNVVNKAFFRSSVQAIKITGELKGKVINPTDVLDWGPIIPFFLEYDYIVITDNFSWNASTMARGAFIGDQVAEFQRLVDWKCRRGLKARIVTITEIMAGVFGNHSTGARDIQEVLRNFLKWALQYWNISWVLLGGDVNVVPVRNAPGASEGH
ncbi:MAG: C25 family cysteine peptidase, partial [Saprospiraceae bacterium]